MKIDRKFFDVDMFGERLTLADFTPGLVAEDGGSILETKSFRTNTFGPSRGYRFMTTTHPPGKTFSRDPMC